MKVYLASPLFSHGEQMFNDFLAKEIREAVDNIDLFLPQENDEINNKEAYANSTMIARIDTDKLMDSDILVCVIDGMEIDSGVACEIGMFATTDKPILALYTDVRQHGTANRKKILGLIADSTENQFMYKNLFVIGTIKRNGYIYKSVKSLVEAVKEYNNI